MLNKVLIITHGLFGIELKKSAEMIMGEQENVEALGLIPGPSTSSTLRLLRSSRRTRLTASTPWSWLTSWVVPPATSLS